MHLDFNKSIQLENEKVLLEPLSMVHHEKLLGHCINNPSLLKYSPIKFGSAIDLKKYIESALDQRKNKNKYAFAIFDKLKQAYAGSTSFMNISLKDKRLEIGSTWIAPEFQKTGLNRHMKFLMLNYAFDELMVERVELKTDDRNIQSKTAIQKIGAKYEGTLRSHMLMTDGYRRDTVYYSIIKNEWLEIQESIFKDFKSTI